VWTHAIGPNTSPLLFEGEMRELLVVTQKRKGIEGLSKQKESMVTSKKKAWLPPIYSFYENTMRYWKTVGNALGALKSGLLLLI
jgi:hypothetical protein